MDRPSHVILECLAAMAHLHALLDERPTPPLWPMTLAASSPVFKHSPHWWCQVAERFTALDSVVIDYADDRRQEIFTDEHLTRLSASTRGLRTFRGAIGTDVNGGVTDAHVAALLQNNAETLRELDLIQGDEGDRPLSEDAFVVMSFSAPPQFRCVSLVKLRLGPRLLSAHDLKALPTALAACLALQDVSLESVACDPASVGLLVNAPSLTKLSMVGCGLGSAGGRAIANALSLGQSQLTSLCLQRNDLNHAGAEALGVALQTTARLRTVDLSLNRIGGGISSLTAAMARNPTLTDVDLSFNQFTLETAEEVANAIELNPNMTTVRWNGFHAETPGLMLLAQAMCRSDRVEHFELKQASLNVEGAVAIAAMLRKTTTLKTVTLENIDVREARAVDFVARGLLQPGNRLTRLSFSSVTTNARTVQAIGSHVALQEIVVKDCGIGDAETEALVQSLSRLTELHVLDLSCNGITAVGETWLARWLADPWCQLRVLRLDSNIGLGLTPDGGTHLGDALITNIELRELHCGKCGLKDEAAVSLARALRTNSTLTVLDVSQNFICDSGGEAIAGMLHGNCFLKQLNLSSNDIGASHLASIVDAARHHCAIEVLDVTGSSVGDTSELLNEAAVFQRFGVCLHVDEGCSSF